MNPAAASPWMTAEECAIYLRYLNADGTPNLDRIYQARKRLGLPASHAGGSRSLLFHRQFVDEWVREGARPRLLQMAK